MNVNLINSNTLYLASILEPKLILFDSYEK